MGWLSASMGEFEPHLSERDVISSADKMKSRCDKSEF
jgi:hypothetical protein